MKTKLVTLICAAAFAWCGTTSALAGTKDAVDVVADAVLVRPACIVSAAVGSVLWVVALPFSVPSKSTKSTAKVLKATVVKSWEEYRDLEQRRRFGREFWRPLLWTLLVLIVVEIWLQQRVGRSKR